MKRFLRGALFPLIVLSGLKAQSSVTEWPLYAVEAVGREVRVEQVEHRQYQFDDRGFNRVVTAVGVPTLTVYRPAQSAHRGAAVVICPGGGYKYVVIDREGHALARWLQARGVTAAVLKYRLPKPETVHGDTAEGLPMPQQDALAALAWVRERVGDWGGDPSRVGILGASAGGHLAGSTAVFGRADAGTRPDFVALLYPVVCMTGPAVHSDSRLKLLGAQPTETQLQQFSLEQQTVAGMPSHFLVHARNDRAVPPENSELLAAALRREQVPVELLLFQSGGHGFSLGRDAESARWPEVFLAWLDALP